MAEFTRDANWAWRFFSRKFLIIDLFQIEHSLDKMINKKYPTQISQNATKGTSA